MNLAQVVLWGTPIGVVALEDGQRVASFEYLPEFRGSGMEVAPLAMPLTDQVYRFPELNHSTFHGLPGLLADSLPDKYGNALINSWLAKQGRSADSFNVVERLCYTGQRGMGALEFKPAQGPKAKGSSVLKMAELVLLASDILFQREGLRATFAGPDRQEAMEQILLVGTSAGGARAKAVIAWNPLTGKVRSGQIEAGSGFEYWLIKFDGVSGNRDKELADPKGIGAIEFAYSQMAQAAGITMSPCQLHEEGGRRHFMTKRFDRGENGAKLHMQSLGALGHFDFNMAGAYGYEQALQTIQRLEMPFEDREEQFRRMVFNVMARNQDDHVKNIAFLMDKKGQWRLSPAFDVTYSYNPAGEWTSRHQMSINGKTQNFVLDDLLSCGASVSLPKKKAKKIVDQVRTAVQQWFHFCQKAEVEDSWQEEIQRNLRLEW